MTQPERIIKARMKVILTAPFFGSLLMRLRMIPDDSVPTFCTNGKVIRYNQAFCASLNDAELRGVLVHEVAHCALGHLWRMGLRHPMKWNIACDYAINVMLDDYARETATGNGGRAPWELPEGGCLDPQFRGMASEDIYNQLPEPITISITVGGGDGKGKPGSGQPSCGEFEAPGTEGGGKESPAGAAELEREWKVAVTQAATVAKMRGQLPACLSRLVTELLEPKVPWREVLREFIREKSRDDYCWQHPNRRYVTAGVILPSLHSERMGRLVCAVDTSGSITDRVLAEFQAEIQAALDECAPECIEVIYCDAAVSGVQEFSPGDAVRLQPQGGGGTDFSKVFEHIAEKEDDPVCLIYLTDLCGRFPDTEPEYPVLWAATEMHPVPFGQVVEVKESR